MNTLSRLFYGGACAALALTLTLQCSSDPNNNGGGGTGDMRGTGTGGGDGGTGTDGGGDGGTGTDGFNPGGINLVSASPVLGSSSGGTTLTLTGTNFPADATVFIDGKQAALSGGITATQIMVTTPADLGKKGKVTIELHRPGISQPVASNSNLFSYFYGTPGFDVPGSYNTNGTSPVAVTLVDLNNNGKLDAVVLNFVSNNISVLLGQGNGTFLSGVGTYSTAMRPTSLAIADFDNDGDPDVVTSNSASDNVTVLLNDGTGVFGSPKPRALATGAQPQGIGAGKLNGDVYPDVVSANATDLSLMLGAAGGNLAAPTSINPDTMTPPSPNAVAIVDLNKDGKLDILTANTGTSHIGVQLGDGNGNFTMKGPFNTGLQGPFELAVADFNGDGILDVATTLEFVNAPTVSVLLGQIDGSLGTYNQFSAGELTGDAPRGIAAGDLNGDGLADLVVALNASTKVAVLIAQPGGSFAQPITYTVGPAPRGVAIGDLNGDGNPDVVVTTYTNNQIQVLLNKFQ